jgi:hypothetical protein
VELLSAYPDIEDVALELFAELAPTVLTTPETLVPPLIQVRRVGGTDNRITDQPRIEVQSFGASHASGRDLAEACRQTVLAAVATTVAGASIDRAWTESAPVYVAYGDPTAHRYVATYRIEVRRPR